MCVGFVLGVKIKEVCFNIYNNFLSLVLFIKLSIGVFVCEIICLDNFIFKGVGFFVIIIEKFCWYVCFVSVV